MQQLIVCVLSGDEARRDGLCVSVCGLLCELQGVDFIGKSQSHSTDLQGQDCRILLCVCLETQFCFFPPSASLARETFYCSEFALS